MKKTFEQHQKEAEQGDAVAQYNLALSYYDGERVAKDEKQAIDWFKKAAEQGHDDASIQFRCLLLPWQRNNKRRKTSGILVE